MSRASLNQLFLSLVVFCPHAFAFPKFPWHIYKSQVLLFPMGCYPQLQNQAGANTPLHQCCSSWWRTWRSRYLAGKDVLVLQLVMWLSQRGRKIWRPFSNGTSGGYQTSALALRKGLVLARSPHQHHTTNSILHQQTHVSVYQIPCMLHTHRARIICNCWKIKWKMDRWKISSTVFVFRYLFS